MQKKLLLIGFLAAALSSCDDGPEKGGTEEGGGTAESVTAGFYVLNEGQYGGNDASLDFYNFETAAYATDLYPAANPAVVLELGDSGNDIALHDGRLYAVLTGSHKVEIMDAATAVRIAQVDMPSPRCIAFDDNYAYISCLVSGNTESNCGSIVRVSLAEGTIAGRVDVGMGPEEMVVTDGKLYVANSAAWPDFDNTISVIDLATFTLQSSITVSENLHHLRLDGSGNMWVSARGNYADVPSDLYRLQRRADGSYDTPEAVGVACTNFAIDGDKIYYYATEWDADWNAVQTFGMVDIATAKPIPGSFITDGTAAQITTPYCIAVAPGNDEIIITDARNYQTSGEIRCYSTAGTLKWKAATGICPAHIAFL